MGPRSIRSALPVALLLLSGPALAGEPETSSDKVAEAVAEARADDARADAVEPPAADAQRKKGDLSEEERRELRARQRAIHQERQDMKRALQSDRHQDQQLRRQQSRSASEVAREEQQIQRSLEGAELKANRGGGEPIDTITTIPPPPRIP